MSPKSSGQHVAALAIRHEKSGHGIVTVSGGVSTVIPGGDLNADDLVRRADAALYAAKCDGRNRIVANLPRRAPEISLPLSQVA